MVGTLPDPHEPRPEVSGETTNTHDRIDDTAAPGPAVYAGIFFVSMAVLVLQVALTRVFAIMMWYHFSYLIISLALLGFGASGSLLTLIGIERRTDAEASRLLGRYSLLFGIGVLVSFFAVSRIRVDTFALWENPLVFLRLAAVFLILSVPFLAAGLTIGTCLTRYRQRVSYLYFVDLVGAAIGAVGCPLLLGNLGLVSTIMLCGALALLGALAFSAGTVRWIRRTAAFSCGVSVLLAVGFGAGWMHWRIPYDPNKKVPQDIMERTLPSAVAQVDVSGTRTMPMSMGGEFGVVDRRDVESRIVAQDGTAPTFLFEGAGDYRSFPQLDDTQAASAYVALNAAGVKKKLDVMVIGVGGGVDVMVALFHDAASVTAVEINQAMIRMVTETYRDYIGRLFDDPRITVVNEDGRSYLSRTDRRFDVIQLSGVDTFTALSTGAYTLSESYLYTLEAVTALVSRLTENGIVNYSRFIIEEAPRETLRLAHSAYVALERLGIEHPERHIAVLQADTWASTMIKKGPFTAKEIAALRRFSRVEGFKGLVFPASRADLPEDPGQPERAPSLERMRGIFARVLSSSPRERADLVRDYPYDLTPATDDQPFFFNYFKLSSLVTSRSRSPTGELGEYLHTFPVAHAVLLSSALIIGVLALLLILGPLWLLRRQNIGRGLKTRTFVYFMSLGIGFMFIEISMMQRFILFLGHPIYSMAVVLGGVLVFSGSGALFSARFTDPGPRVTRTLLAVLVGLTLFNAFLLASLLAPLQSASLSVRVLVTLVLLAPTGFVLGMPLPLGVKMLDRAAPGLIPWAWAVNGFLSVLSSILATVVAMIGGFTAVLLAAGAIYAVGLLMAPHARPPAAAAPD
jgi:hypothetical protein